MRVTLGKNVGKKSRRFFRFSRVRRIAGRERLVALQMDWAL
jgi:hypothetical protein